MMKMFIAAVAILLTATTSFAQSQSGSNSNSGANSQSGVNFAPHYGGSRGAASAIAPSYNPGFGSCRSGIPIGGAGGGFGFSFGIPLDDAKCDTREDARYMAVILGDQAAAKERLCDSRKMREAFARANRPCRGDNVAVAYERAPLVRSQPARKVSGRNYKLDLCLKRAETDPSVNCRSYR